MSYSGTINKRSQWWWHGSLWWWWISLLLVSMVPCCGDCIKHEMASSRSEWKPAQSKNNTKVLQVLLGSPWPCRIFWKCIRQLRTNKFKAGCTSSMLFECFWILCAIKQKTHHIKSVGLENLCTSLRMTKMKWLCWWKSDNQTHRELLGTSQLFKHFYNIFPIR